MKAKEVPQDDASLFEGKTRDVQYAVDEHGNYTTVKSVGWGPKNEAMLQAWEVEREKMDNAWEDVEQSKKSPVYYHMVRCLMDIKLVASYTGFSRWKIRRHFRPGIYKTLSAEVLEKYRYAFGLDTVDDINKPLHHED